MGACIQRIGAGEQENVIRAVAEAMRRSVISILKNVRRLRRKRKNILSKPISFGIREISCRKRMASICVAKSRTICIECSILQLICLKWTMNSLVFAVLGFTMSIVNGAMSR
nr:MAG TPA: hypothetical protein [Caudoviricetes sp.]